MIDLHRNAQTWPIRGRAVLSCCARVIFQRKFAIIHALLFTLAPLAAAQDEAKRQTVRSIIAAWEARKAQITSISCVASVESFYPKGYLSEQIALEHPNRKDEPLSPKQDQRIMDESCSWAFDFSQQRVRKEYELTSPFFYHQGTAELALDYSLHIFTKGKYRFFRPRERYPPKAREAGLAPDVHLYEGGSHVFMLTFADLPLLWTAGGVNGSMPLPTEMQLLETISAFTHRAQANKRGQKCTVLTLPEQRSRTSVREFWVGNQDTHPIYHCRMRDGDKVYWEIDVEYADQAGRLLPTSWVFTLHSRPGTLFWSRTFAIKELKVNSAMPAELFEKQLRAGSVAFVPAMNEAFDVDRNGKLVPLGSASGGSTFTNIFVGIMSAVVLALAIIAGRRLLRKQSC